MMHTSPLWQASTARTRFGFVWFEKQEEATKSVELFNGATISGRRFSICLVKYEKGRARSQGNHGHQSMNQKPKGT